MPFGCTRINFNSVTQSAVLAVGHPCYLVAARGFTTAGTEVFIQFFDANATSGITVGTTVPDWVLDIVAGSANGSVSVGDGVPSNGLRFDNGIVIAATGGSTTNTAPTGTVYVRLGIQ